MRKRLTSLILSISMLAGQMGAVVPPRAAAASGTPDSVMVATTAAVGDARSPGGGRTGVLAGQSAGHVIVKFRPGVSAAEQTAVIASRGASRGLVSRAADRARIASPGRGQSAEQLRASLAADPAVEYAELDYVRELLAYTPPNDPAFNDTSTWSDGADYYLHAKHWWLDNMNAEEAWRKALADDGAGAHPLRGSAASFRVAVIDGGFHLSHPELAGKVAAGKDVFASYDYDTNTFTMDDDVSPMSGLGPTDAAHGTATAGTVAAKAHNGEGGLGIGYDNLVLAYKVEGPVYNWPGYPDGTPAILDSAIATAIRMAADAGAKVINMSLGGPDPSQVLQDAVNYAHGKGAVVVASTGNASTSRVYYPAACSNVLGVGALQASGGSSTTMGTITRASFSNYGPECDLVAPGEMMWLPITPGYDADGSGSSTQPGYYWWGGTSFSSPAVAGAIAFLWRTNPNLTKQQIESFVLTSATRDMGAAGRDNEYGYGALDVDRGYAAMIASYPRLLPPASVVAAAHTRDSTPDVSWSAVSGTSVTYDVLVDGAFQANTASTSFTPAAPLGDGDHTIAIQPRSEMNWYGADARKSVTVEVDTIKPVISNFARTAQTITWDHTEEDKDCITVAQMDAGPPEEVVGTSYVFSGLSEGSHTLRVTVTDPAGNQSETGVYTFDYQTPPAAPTLPSNVTSERSSYVLDWLDVAGVTGYEVEVNEDGPYTATQSQYELSLEPHANTVRVRSVKNSERSDWAVTTVSWEPPVPASPAPTASSPVSSPSVRVSWSAVDHAQNYEYRLGLSGTVRSTTALSVDVSGLAQGPNTVYVRTANFNGTSAWAPVQITYMPPLPGVVTFDQSFSSPVYVKPVVVSWGAVANATGYEYSINGASAQATTGRSVLVVAPLIGANQVRVRATNYAGPGPWSSIDFVYEVRDYTLVYAAGAGGTVLGELRQTVAHGSSGSPVTAVPAAGHRFVGWSDGVTDATRTETNVTADRSLIAQFEPVVGPITMYTFSYAAGAGGTLVGEPLQSVAKGVSGSPVTAVPAAGYRFVRWSDGVAEPTRTDGPAAGNVAVIAEFAALPIHDVRYLAGLGGSVEGQSAQRVIDGSDGTTVTAVPEPGYRFSGWSDGLAVASRLERSVRASFEVTAAFSKVIPAATIKRSPSASKVIYKRKRGTATYTLSATFTGWGGQALRRKYVYLETSSDGKKWKRTYKLRTTTTGKASKTFKVNTTLRRYYRWYVPANAGINLRTTSKSTRVTVQ